MNGDIDFNKTLNGLSKKYKFLLILCLLLIFGALYYLAFTERILVYKEKGINVCNETYKIGKLISPMCIQNPQHPNYEPPNKKEYDKYNIGNITWNLTID